MDLLLFGHDLALNVCIFFLLPTVALIHITYVRPPAIRSKMPLIIEITFLSFYILTQWIEQYFVSPTELHSILNVII